MEVLNNKQNENEAFYQGQRLGDENVLDIVSSILRENVIATFAKESDTSLWMRFVGGRQFRLTVQEVLVNV